MRNIIFLLVVLGFLLAGCGQKDIPVIPSDADGSAVNSGGTDAAEGLTLDTELGIQEDDMDFNSDELTW